MKKSNPKKKRIIRSLIILLVLGALVSVFTVKPNQFKKMRPPAIMDDKRYNPFRYRTDLSYGETVPILFASNRAFGYDRKGNLRYTNNRQSEVLLGEAEISIAGEEQNWHDMTTIEAGQSSLRNPILQVDQKEIFGTLERSRSEEGGDDLFRSPGAEELFKKKMLSQMEASGEQDVYIFIHGYKVNFENPLLIAVQLWHYMGYNGSFIAYSWPSTSHRNLAYMKDLDTASMSARSFRLFLDFLADQEEIENIHIIGYSAGTRLVTQTLYQKALQLGHLDAEEARKKTKLGTVILAGSDMDPGIFTSYILDDITGILEKMTLYSSSKDIILLGSRLLHFTPRLGQTVRLNKIPEQELSSQRIEWVDVSDAPSIYSRGAHFYFLESPWVSSDVLINLWMGISPGERGLVREEGEFYWRFPADYIEAGRSRMDSYLQDSLLAE